MWFVEEAREKLRSRVEKVFSRTPVVGVPKRGHSQHIVFELETLNCGR